ncbi:hypothetical protein DI392_16270 [Vibrio albus]|uniref:DUF2861 family protein n=1 Tax=Vibrio albus TaxID=2200953 RepID=A0A2U3B6F5_9VIBR|nr:hypothetical protein DI392_16270 [Vibrio albus]
MSLFLFTQSVLAAWFEEQTSLTQAHQAILEDDLPAAFSAMVEVWQKERAPYVKEHLNQLLLKSLDKDCGKTLHSEEFAPWITRVVIRNQSVQSPGRRTERVTVEVTALEGLEDIEFTRWPETKVSRSSDFESIIEQPGNVIYQRQYALNRKLEPGLYQVRVEAADNKVWNSWVIISTSAMKQVVRWESKDHWVVDKKALLNSYCPLPVLDVSLYDYIDDQYIKVWQQKYEADYPTTIPIQDLIPNRYVLAVSIAHQHWQGSIIIENQQVISKTYDISEE